MKYTALQNFIRNNVYKTLPCVLLVFFTVDEFHVMHNLNCV